MFVSRGGDFEQVQGRLVQAAALRLFRRADADGELFHMDIFLAELVSNNYCLSPEVHQYIPGVLRERNLVKGRIRRSSGMECRQLQR